MPIPLPYSAINKFLGWLMGWLARKLFLPTYCRARIIFSKTHRLGAYWKTEKYFEYSTFFPLFKDPEPRI